MSERETCERRKREAFVLVGKMWTCGMEAPRRGALRIADGRIASVAFGEERSDAGCAEVLDYGDNLILPGFTDAHIHFTAYARRGFYPDLSAVSSLEEFLQAVADAASDAPRGVSLRCVGYDEAAWAKPVAPSRALLDTACADRPVVASRYCGHVHALNTAALEHSGLWDADDPNVERDERGEPTGLVFEGGASALLARIAAECETPERAVAMLKSASATLSSHGVTCAHICDAPDYSLGEDLAAIRALEARGELTLRAFCYHDADLDTACGFGCDTPLVAFAGRKIFLDGSLSGYTAALKSPYADRPNTCGALNYDDEALYASLLESARRGVQVQAHAIGDRALEQLLRAADRVREAVSVAPAFLRINHATVTSAELVGRIARDGFFVDVQPIEAYSDRFMAPLRLGAARAAYAYAFRQMLDAGVPLSGSSDAPIEDPNPWLGVWAMACRDAYWDGEPDGAGRATKNGSLQEALAAYTATPWRALGGGRCGGELKAGYPADLTVVDGDPFETERSALRAVENLATFMDGRCVWRKE